MRAFFIFIFLSLFSITGYSQANLGFDNRLKTMQNELDLSYRNISPLSAEVLFSRATEARAIYSNRDLSASTRINANLLYSGFIGLYAQAKKSEEFGRKSYNALKENFELDPKHKNASMAFADAILGIYNSPFCFIVKRRYGIENMNTDLNFAQANLKQFLPDQDARKKLDQLEKVSF